MSATHRLQRLFEPRSIAVVGASPRGGFGLNVVANLGLLGFGGDVVAIHPSAERVHDAEVFRSLRDVPFVPDAVVAAVPAAATVDVVAESAHLGVGGVVAFASGFREGGEAGQKLETELRSAAGDRLAVLGPNCMGLVNYRSRAAMWGIEAPRKQQRGGGRVAVAAQSGAMLITTLLSGRLPDVAYAVSVGNQAVVDMNDCLDYFLADPDVRTVALVAEGISDLARFRRLADAAQQRDVSVVVLKLGRSARARVASVAHTGTLSGDDDAYRAVFKQAGVHAVDDLDELIATCSLLTHVPRARGGTLAAFATSGGECGLVADAAEQAGVELAQLDAGTAARLAPLVPEYGSVGNPLDLTAGAWADPEVYRSVTAALAAGPEVALVAMVGDAPQHLGTLEDSGWPQMLAGAGAAGRDAGVPVAVMTTTTDVLAGFGALAQQHGVLLLAGTRPAMRAIACAQAAGQARADDAVAGATEAPARTVAAARALIRGRAGVLAEARSKELVELFGIATPPGGQHHDIEELGRVAARIGYPVACKVAGVAHKSDIGGVRTGIRDEAELRAACEQIRRAVEGVVRGIPEIRVERMITSGVEVLVGGRNGDSGTVVVVGAGGVLTELLQDAATLVWPFTADDVVEALSGLRIAPMLTGYRGSAGTDVTELARVAVHAGQLLASLPEVREMDLNPVLASTDGCHAVDALIVLDDGQE